jgi:hypothetical protein
MMKRNYSLISMVPALGILLLSISLSGSAVAYADAAAPTPNQGNCIYCHENLYFLHDTGNWYCLKEAPMSCVDCHGGDPLATTADQAHSDRAAHPVINDDISKCQQCHPVECVERTQIFDQNAGISDVLIALPYTPRTNLGDASMMPVKGTAKSRIARASILILLLAAVTWIAWVVREKRAGTR